MPETETRQAGGRWTVWRIDDTGNTFVVRERLSREEADRAVAEFEARGHKQTYWAERERGATVDVHIRPATADDLPAIRDIFNHYVATSTCTFQIDPDTPEERAEWFRDRGPAHPVTVAVLGGFVAGWAALSPWKSRCAYAKSAEASVYVRHDLHRKGIGRGLLADLVARGRVAGLHTIVGGACTEQPASLALQESLGFARVACFREVGYKFGRWLDVAYTQLMLGNKPEAVPCGM
jgi:phosphinothricin acetyltransferase